MAKANIDLPDGTKIVIDGSVDEVAKIVALVQGGPGSVPVPGKKPAEKLEAPSVPKKKAKAGPIAFIRELKEEGFFQEKRTLSDVRRALEAKAHIYPSTQLSPAMVRLTRKRELGRLKENGKWVYVHRD